MRHHAGRHVDGVAENVGPSRDDGSGMEPDPDRQRLDAQFCERDRLLDRPLHGHGRFRSIVGDREGAHQLIADVLDDGPLISRCGLRKQTERLGDDGLGAGVAERLVNLGAAAHVDKQDGARETGTLKL